MTDTSAQEPTMEEILASIRRIISEDDAPVAEPAAAPEPPAVVAPEPVAAPEPVMEDILDLTEPVAAVAPPAAPAPVRAPVVADFDDIEIMPREPVRRPEPAYGSPASDDSLLSQTVAESAASHFGSLAQTVFMPGEGRTLEDVVKDLLRPLLKEWLDTHLSAIVEAKVQSEVERISRRRVY
jgi:cell pole-organizing protein PopZ